MTSAKIHHCKITSGAIQFILFTLLAVWLLGMTAVGLSSDLTHSKVRIYAKSERQMRSLNEAGLVFGHIQVVSGGFETVLNSIEMDLLKKSRFKHKVLVADLEERYRKRRKLSRDKLADLERKMRKTYNVPQGFEFGSMGGFYTNTEVIAQLDEMVANYPSLITAKQSIGTTIEGRDIWMVKISDNPNVDETEEEVLYTGLMHAREPQSMTTGIYFMFYLLENYGSDPTVTFLVDNRELYFIPVINPDGYVYNQTTNPNGGGMWRKNRRVNTGGSFGVDINRNFSYQWGFNNNGSSPNPGSSTYRGTSAASEPETQAVQNFAISRDLTMAFNYHSYANSYNFPWGYKPNFFTPDQAQFVAYSQDMSQFNNYRYGTPWSNLGYVTNGYSNDWFYGEQTLKDKVFSWTVEVGKNSDGFWPNQNRIIPLAEENIYPNLALAWGVAGSPPTTAVTATPHNPPVIVPNTGGQFTFDVEVENVTSFSMNTQFWTYAVRPGGGITDALFGPINLSLEPGQKYTNTITQNIPPVDLAGFTYRCVTGKIPAEFGSDEFQVTVSFAPQNAKVANSASIDNWDAFETPRIQSAENVANEFVPENFSIEQNYPNPFNPSTTISYSLPVSAQTLIVVYDLQGRTIRELINQPESAGQKSVQWDGKNATGNAVASGLYLYRIQSGSFTQTRKMLLVK